MAVCPSLVDTPLARGALNINNDEKFSSNASEVGLRALLPSEVAEALEYLVVSGASGEALMVYPGFTFFWPNVQLRMLEIFCSISKFLNMVLVTRKLVQSSPDSLSES